MKGKTFKPGDDKDGEISDPRMDRCRTQTTFYIYIFEKHRTIGSKTFSPLFYMSSAKSRPFAVKADPKGNTVDIQIGELPGIVAENLGLATWGAAVVLADILYRWTEEIQTSIGQDYRKDHSSPVDLSQHISILELGAGTGLAGLTASALWNLPAVLTDLEPVIPGIAHNISLNPSLQAFSGTLDWTQPSTLVTTTTTTDHQHQHQPTIISSSHSSSSSTKASIILAADTCYTSSHPHLITSTVKTWLQRHKSARAIFCYPLRMSYLDHARNLWSEMERQGFVAIEEGREEARELWGEIAPVPYEWSVWGWRDFHPEAVAKEEAERDKGEVGWLAM